jgi:hypothetical protein
MRALSIPRHSLTILLLLALLLLFPCAFGGCSGEAGADRRDGDLAAQQPAMEKWVSPSATVVLYRPAGWAVEEGDLGGVSWSKADSLIPRAGRRPFVCGWICVRARSA